MITPEILSPEPKAEDPAPVHTQHNQQALMVRETGGAVGRALSMDELKANLRFVHQVMKDVMTEDVDYGKVPGCGDKPGLFQPGAQKLLMTFQLTDHVLEERVTDFPGYHREYSFRIGVKATNGKMWEGVGTCSTLESKHRYRGGARKCPECGKPAIIKGRKEYGGGWLCFGKKGGCGAKWDDGDQVIESQSEEKIENDNPADCWNTARKMGFKRALVHAAINATNTSELWSQDLEDLGGNGNEMPPPASTQGKAGATKSTPNAQSTAGSRQNAPQGKPASSTGTSKNHPPATEAENKTLFVNQLRGKLGSVELENLFLEFLEMTRNSKDEFFISPGQMLQDVALEDLRALVNYWDKTVNPKFIDWQFQMRKAAAIEADAAKAAGGGVGKVADAVQAAADSPRPASLTGAIGKDPEWFMEVIVPIPQRGVKKADYMKNPDTIGSLFRARHSNREAMRRLMGFVGHYVPEGWTNPRTNVRTPPSEADKAFRVALDAFSDWYEKHGQDKEAPQTELAGMPASGDMPPAGSDDSDVPF
jgi:hypothetical protein